MDAKQFAAVIKEVGRGARGARGVSPELAEASFAALLAGEISDAQLGAWWLAMRIKGETLEELAAFERAMQASLAFRIPAETTQRTVLLPCYNGARQLPNLVPLQAWALTQRGISVLMHGVEHDPTRVTTYMLCQALDWPIVKDATSAQVALTTQGLAFAPLGSLHPQLARLLDWRWHIGLRSAPHTIAKLLQPMTGEALRVVALTHGEYIERMGEYLQAERLSGLVFRGCEGEPLLHPKRKMSVRICRNGESHMLEWPGVTAHDLPENFDVASTLAYSQSVMRGERPIPPWIDWFAQVVQQSFEP